MPILEAEQLVMQQYLPFLLKVETNQSSKNDHTLIKLRTCETLCLPNHLLKNLLKLI